MTAHADLPHPLLDASVLLLGATGGLGGALATELRARGANLTLSGRDVARLESLPVDGHRFAGDLRSPEVCGRVVEEARSYAGRLDVVVNAVGVVAFGTVDQLSTDAMEELFLTNTFVPIMVAKAALPHIDSGGAIVNISGIIAEQNLPGMAAYGASKAATRAFSDGLRREARRAGVRVLDVRPPHTETGLADRPIEGVAPNMPSGLTPDEVARVICDALERGDSDVPSSAF